MKRDEKERFLSIYRTLIKSSVSIFLNFFTLLPIFTVRNSLLQSHSRNAKKRYQVYSVWPVVFPSENRRNLVDVLICLFLWTRRRLLDSFPTRSPLDYFTRWGLGSVTVRLVDVVVDFGSRRFWWGGKCDFREVPN